MSRLFRAIVIGSTAGILGVSVLFAPSLLAAASANDTPATTADLIAAPIEKLFPATPSFDMSRLRKFSFDIAPGVDVTPRRTVTIGKYGYGHYEQVIISTTGTGTYSSDAITSPYVKYPGINVRANADPCTCTGAETIIVPPIAAQTGSFLEVPAPRNASAISWI